MDAAREFGDQKERYASLVEPQNRTSLQERRIVQLQGTYTAAMFQFLFPARSLTGEGGEWLTQKEWRGLEAGASKITRHQLRAMGCQHLDVVLAGDRYGRTPLIRRMIQLFKYKRTQAYLDPLLMLLQRALNQPPCPQPVTLCPVPLHWTRQFLRGFNQSELLARALGKQAQLPVQLLLKRSLRTGWQSHRRDWSDRKTAMQNAFEYAGKNIPKNVLLVDDICTSGATLDACADALKQAGVQWVGGLVVARR